MRQVTRRALEAGAHIEAMLMTFAVTLEVNLRKGPGTDKAHVAFQDAPKIKQFIERGLPYESPPFRDPLLGRQECAVAATLFGHVTKLQDGERLSLLADPRLLEEQRASNIEKRDEGDHSVDRQR